MSAKQHFGYIVQLHCIVLCMWGQKGFCTNSHSRSSPVYYSVQFLSLSSTVATLKHKFSAERTVSLSYFRYIYVMWQVIKQITKLQSIAFINGKALNDYKKWLISVEKILRGLTLQDSKKNFTPKIDYFKCKSHNHIIFMARNCLNLYWVVHISDTRDTPHKPNTWDYYPLQQKFSPEIPWSLWTFWLNGLQMVHCNLAVKISWNLQ